MKNRKVVLSGAIGNMLEFYDFTLFGLLLPTISPLFFPSSSLTASLLFGYLALAVGFLSYPLGAIFFGYIGDIYGRKKSLVLSIIMMAIPTTLIGLLPTYAQVGIIAPALIFACRFMQGICAGGEYSGSGIFVIEHTPENKRGLFSSVVAASGTVGGLLAALVVVCTPLSIEDGWRIPFILGAVLGGVGLYVRKENNETVEFQNIPPSFMKKIPLFEIVKSYPLSVFYTIGIGALGSVPFYLVIGFFNTYLSTTGKIDPVMGSVANIS